MHWDHEPCLIISIGTGEPPETPGTGEPSELPQSRARAFTHMREALETSKWFKKFVLDSESKHLDFQAKLDGENGINSRLRRENKDLMMYCRFNIPARNGMDITSIKLGHWKGEHGNNTKQLMDEAVRRYLDGAEAHQKLTDCARKLVQVRRERQKTERWQRFALNLVYSCPAGKSNMSKCKDLLFPSRLELRQHAIRTHGFAWQVPCIDASGVTQHDWACFWDHCGEHRISVFDTKEEFALHLQTYHQLKEPEIKSRQEIEEWLDEGRWLKPPLVNPS